MKITKHIVRMPNGKYVSNWEYSQGYFSFVDTSDITRAMDIPRDHFDIFFKDEGAVYLRADYEIELTNLTVVAEAIRKST